MKAYKDIDSYIADHPKSVQTLLKKMRATIRKAAPKAKEKIAYGIPTYVMNRNLVHFGGFKHHVSFFPGSGVARSVIGTAGGKYSGGKGTLKFPLDQPLPLGLIAKIVKLRVKEDAARAITICSRGHRFSKSKEQPVCPICWPGRYKKKK